MKLPISLLATAALACFAVSAPAIPPPNIVLIIADDLGYGDLGCYGGRAIPTPHLDRLASEGLRFTHAYAPSATCTPSRYALLTGEYPWRQPPKKTSILDGDAPLALDPARPTLASFLRGQGYATGLVGKWHLGLGDGVTPIDFNGPISPGPLEIGFQEAFFIPATVDRVPCVYIDGHRVAGLEASDPIAVSYLKRIGADPLGHERPELLKYPADRQHADTIINGISRIGHMSGGRAARWIDEDIADVLTRHAVDFIARHHAGPFFLNLGTHDPHVPRMPHPRFRGKSRAGIRGDAIVQLDWIVGEVLRALARHGLEQNTLVLFTSDNGPVLFDGYHDGAAEANGAHTPSGGLRGWKYLRYEGGTRIPLLARWPGRIPAGGTTSEMFSLLDLFATTASLLGRRSAGRRRHRRTRSRRHPARSPSGDAPHEPGSARHRQRARPALRRLEVHSGQRRHRQRHRPRCRSPRSPFRRSRHPRTAPLQSRPGSRRDHQPRHTTSRETQGARRVVGLDSGGARPVDRARTTGQRRRLRRRAGRAPLRQTTKAGNNDERYQRNLAVPGRANRPR